MPEFRGNKKDTKGTKPNSKVIKEIQNHIKYTDLQIESYEKFTEFMDRELKAAKKTYYDALNDLTRLENMGADKSTIKDAKNTVKTAKGLYHFHWKRVRGEL
jgi:hypothetical protein